MPTHQVSVLTTKYTPVVVVNRTWEGPVFVVGEEGENILAVTSSSRVVLPFFVEDNLMGERHDALMRVAQEHCSYDAEVHVVQVMHEGIVGDRIGSTPRRSTSCWPATMFLAPIGAETNLVARHRWSDDTTLCIREVRE